MNLRSELERIADSAPALGNDLADAALANARRHRLRIHVPITVAAAVAIALIGSALVRPNLFGQSFEPAGWSGRVEIPATAEPLPAKGAGPARMTYLWRCPKSTGKNDCVEARVLTADGRHWSVPDVAPLLGRDGRAQHQVLTLSPNGQRIFYSKGKDLVVRDLLSGEVVRYESFGSELLHVSWSPDSKWLALCLREVKAQPYAFVFASGRKDMSGVKADGCPLGLPNGKALVPLNDPDGSKGIPLSSVVLPEADPTRSGEIPVSVVGKRDPEETSGMVSPDGGKLALVRRAGVTDSTLDIFGLDRPRRLHRLRFDSDPTVVGWLDESRFAIVAERLGKDGESLEPTRYDVQVVDARKGKASLAVQVVGTVEAGSISIATGRL